jgi:hypothetical protein
MRLWAFPQVLCFIALSRLLTAQTPSAISLFSSPNPSTYGAAVTVTATVTPSAATGRVTFYDGATVLGDGAVSGSQALLTTHLLATGTRSLRAHYSGDSSYAPADATILPQTVNSVVAASFSPAVTYPVGIAAGAVVTGDFDSDGKLDLAVCSYFGSAIDIFIGNGDGTFQQSATYTIPSPSSIAGGDMNDDGIPDLVTYSDDGITVWIGKGDGTFTQGHSYAAFPPQSVALWDFNGDGNVDVLAGNSSLEPQLWWGNGDGTLTAGPVLTFVANISVQFAIGDFNGDGLPDFATMGNTPASNSFVVFLGNGDGTFTPVNESGNASLAGYQLSAGDLNNDGKLDLVLANGGSSLGVLIGNGDGTFQTSARSMLCRHGLDHTHRYRRAANDR